MKILTAMLVAAGLAIAGANVYAGSGCGYSQAKSDKASCGDYAKAKDCSKPSDCSKPKDCGDKASSDATVAQADGAKSSDS